MKNKRILTLTAFRPLIDSCWLLPLALLLGTACSGDDPDFEIESTRGTGDGGMFADSDASQGHEHEHGHGGGSAPRPVCPASRQIVEGLEGEPAIAVLLSDYASTAIGFLDAEGYVLKGNWINSGSTAPGLVAALSGDVGLPTAQPNDGSFFIVDRLKTDVVSRACLASGTLVGQVRMHNETKEIGYSSNPQDVVLTDDGNAWVSRLEPNVDPTAEPDDLGDDLTQINATTMERTGKRIDLSMFKGPAGENRIHARPRRIVRMGQHLLVGLERMSLDFQQAAEGRLAVVDLGDETVEALPLPGLKNCGRVVPVPGAERRAVVACLGFDPSFADEAKARETAGLVLVEMSDDGEAQVKALWRAADHPSQALAISNMVALGGTEVFAVDIGVWSVSSDVAYRVDLQSGEQEELFPATGAFTIGIAAYEPKSGNLFVPESGTGLLRFRVESDRRVTAHGPTRVAPELSLPVRAAQLLP